jgi:hypothetical protein
VQVAKVEDYTEMPNAYTGMIEYENGSKQWYLNGLIHREDGPAIEFSDGTKWWKLNGIQHRVEGPAVECANGDKHWFLNGKRHRVDGPAIECVDGTKYWYLNGEFLFWLPPESQPFIFLEEFVDEDGKQQIKVLTQEGIEIWPNLPGIKELADNWETIKS